MSTLAVVYKAPETWKQHRLVSRWDRVGADKMAMAKTSLGRFDAVINFVCLVPAHFISIGLHPPEPVGGACQGWSQPT